MALANLYQPANVAGTEFDGMSPMRLGALSAMARVPGFMENIAKNRPATGHSGSWDPMQAMAVLNPRGHVRYDPTQAAIQSKGFRIGSANPFGDAINSLLPQLKQYENELRAIQNDPGRRFRDMLGVKDPRGPSKEEQRLQSEINAIKEQQERARIRSSPELWSDDQAAYNELMKDLSTIQSSGQSLGQHTYFYPYKKGRTKSSVHSGYDAPFVEGNEADYIARALAGYGVKDMADIGATLDEKGNTVFFNQTTGQALPANLFTGYHKGQKNVTEYSLGGLPDGTIAPVYNSVYTSNSGRKSRGLGSLAKFVGIGGSFFLPGAGAALGTALGGIGATAGTALAGAGLGAATSALSGGNAFKGALMGGVGGGLGAHLSSSSSMLGGISNPVVRGAASGALSGAVKGGLGAGLYGGDVGKGILGGGITGGLSSLGGAAMGGDPNTMLGKLTGYAGSTLGQRVGGQLAGQLVGSPFEQQQSQQAPRQQVVRPAAPAPIPAWLPQHAQDAIRRSQGVA